MAWHWRLTKWFRHDNKLISQTFSPIICYIPKHSFANVGHTHVKIVCFCFSMAAMMMMQEVSMSPCEPKMKEKAWRLCRDFLSGAWKKVSSDEIVVKRFSGGLSNFLYYCALPNSTTPLADEPSQVLLRIYGQMHENDVVETVITQSVIFTLLSERCLGPKLYGVFPEGRIEEYIPARPLLTTELTDPCISASIASRLAKIHSLHVPINKEPTWLPDTMSRYLQQIRTKVASGNPEDQEKARKLLSYSLEKEYDWIMKMIPKMNSPVIFSHNDLQEGNILVYNNTPLSESWLLFIDYEYCSYNYRGFDFGNHFCEWCYDYTNPDPPYFYVNMLNYPNREQQLNFIRSYLRSYPPENGCSKSVQHNSVMMRAEEKILKEAAYFALVSHYFWGLWAIINGGNTEIQFGYWDYALARLDAYFKGKAQVLASDNAKKKTATSE